MIQKLKDLEQEAMDELDPEDYEKVKYIVNKYDLTGHESNLYKCGYLDGLQAAIVAVSENSGTHSYSINIDDIFDNE